MASEAPQVQPSSSGNNEQGALHVVTKECRDGTDVVSVTWFSDKMPRQHGGDNARYKLQEYAALREALSNTAVDAIKKLGFGSFLDIKMHTLPDRNIPIWLASFFRPAKCRNEEAVVFVLDKSYPRVLTGQGVQLLLGLPMGNQNVPDDLLQNLTSSDRVTEAFYSALEHASKQTNMWTMAHMAEACRQAKDDHMLQVRLFLAAIFEFAIFTSSSNYLSAENRSRVLDIQKLVKTNLCEELILSMQKCLKTYDDCLRVHSPLTFALFCMENMDCDLPGDLKTPRWNFYSEEAYDSIVAAFKQRVNLKDWKNTVFGRNNIEEFQVSEIKYVENYKEPIKKRNTQKKLDKDPPVKRPRRNTEKLDKDPPVKRPRRNTDDNNNNKHDQFFHADIDRDTLDFYNKHVIGRTRDKIVLNILDHDASELNYVECFKPKGYMHTSIMFMRCALWNEEWKEKGIDKVIVSHKAMLELLNPNMETRFLAAELQANLIFIPIVFDHHWFLMVISRNKETIYILDSFPSKSKEDVIFKNLLKLKNLLGSSYKSEVLQVLPQKNSYDCGFHVLLYISGFNDENTEQICHVNKDMVDKFRIETSVYLRRHKLNKPPEVVVVSNDDDDDDTEIIEDTFSYDEYTFNAALCGECEDSLSSSPMYSNDDNATYSNISDDDDLNKESNKDGKKENKESNEDGKNLESNVGEKTKDSKVEENLRDKKTDNTMAGNGRTQGSKVVITYTRRRRSQQVDNSGEESEKEKKLHTSGVDNSGEESEKEKKLHTSGVDNSGEESEKEKQLGTSGVMHSRSERQIIPTGLHDDLHDKRSHPSYDFGILEDIYKAAIDCKEQVILKFKLQNSVEVSMTGSQLEKCLQGGHDARDLIIILMALLSTSHNGMTRIFASPFHKDDESLEDTVSHALRSVNKRVALRNKIIYFPVFFSGEWIVVCFVFQDVKDQIHIYCHKDSYDEVRKFSLSLKNSVCKVLAQEQKMMRQQKVASTKSIIKADDSVVASMYFLDYFFASRSEIRFAKFTTESDEVRDDFVKAIKYEYVRYMLMHRKNNGDVPELVKLLKSGLLK